MRSSRRLRANASCVRAVAALGAAGILGAAAPASGHEFRGDGLYGRFEADTALALGGGLTVGTFGNAAAATVATLEARAIYLQAAGLSIAAALPTNGGARIDLCTEMRPVVLGLVFTNRATGAEFFDLLIESVALVLGVELRTDAPASTAGFVAGGALEVPLVTSHGWGLRIRLAGQAVIWSPAAGPDARVLGSIVVAAPLALGLPPG